MDFNDTQSWTVAGLTDFKDLYQTLSSGRLQWVLSAGLPLHSDFEVFLNGRKLTSTKENLEVITHFPFAESIPGIGEIKGSARIHKKPLTTGKSLQYGRSNEFFIRVRGRVINLEDELFGITQPNHAAWSRFALEVDADGLRHYLLSSREGVRDSETIRQFRAYLLTQFNRCRNLYEEWERKQQQDFDIAALLSDEPSSHVLDPLFRSVSTTIRAKSESFYVAAADVPDESSESEWTHSYQTQATTRPFEHTRFAKEGVNAPALRYNPNDRVLVVNSDHPFVDKITNGDKRRTPAKLFASSEVLLEGQLQEYGIAQALIANVLRDRDRVLRLMAGDAPPTATEVLRRLSVATQDDLALERAVGAVFQLLGFDYERRGGNRPGTDGVLYARLGRQEGKLADYKLVYDAKQTNQPSVPAQKVPASALEDFRRGESADFGFFVADAYQGETDPESAVNRRIAQAEGGRLSMLKVGHLGKLVWPHLRHGVTLTELRSLFETARTVREVDCWIEEYEDQLEVQGDVPLRLLLEGLEEDTRDLAAAPNMNAVRVRRSELRRFSPERLVARLKAVESIVGKRWLEVNEESRDVALHQNAANILEILERNVEGLTNEARGGS